MLLNFLYVTILDTLQTIAEADSQEYHQFPSTHVSLKGIVLYAIHLFRKLLIAKI